MVVCEHDKPKPECVHLPVLCVRDVNSLQKHCTLIWLIIFVSYGICLIGARMEVLPLHFFSSLR